ncbi:MAG: hypothetical protein ACE10D_03680 [Planctomycetota bacterium]
MTEELRPRLRPVELMPVQAEGRELAVTGLRAAAQASVPHGARLEIREHGRADFESARPFLARYLPVLRHEPGP